MKCSLCDNNIVAWVSQAQEGGAVEIIGVCMAELMGWAAREDNASVADFPAFWNRVDRPTLEVPAAVLRTPRAQVLAEISGGAKPS